MRTCSTMTLFFWTLGRNMPTTEANGFALTMLLFVCKPSEEMSNMQGGLAVGFLQSLSANITVSAEQRNCASLSDLIPKCNHIASQSKSSQYVVATVEEILHDLKSGLVNHTCLIHSLELERSLNPGTSFFLPSHPG